MWRSTEHAKLASGPARYLHFRHLLTLFGITIVIASWALVWSYLHRSEVDNERIATAQVENMAFAIERNVENDIRQIDILLKVLLATKRLIGFDRVSLHPMKEVFAVKDFMLHVSFTDASGNVGDNTSFPDKSKKVNIADREHFRVHIDAKPPGFLFVSKPLMGRGTGKHTIQFSRGIYGADGQFQGAMVAGVSPEALLTGFEFLKLGAGSGVAIVGDDGIVRASSGSLATTIGLQFSPGNVRSVSQATDSSAEITNALVDGVERKFATVRITGFPLRVVVDSGVQSRNSSFTGQEFLLILGTTMLSLLVGFLVYAGQRGMVIEHLRIALRDQTAANAMQRNFIAMASHEFRTPMAIIDSSAQKLRSRASTYGPKDIIERSVIIRGAVKRMSDLIERILSVAKLEEGGLQLRSSPFSISDLLAECIARAQEVEQKRIFRANLGEASDCVVGDRKLLDHVFSNLIANAVKYSPGDSPVTVSCRLDDDIATIEIMDSGIGIDQDDVSKLFTRFFRAKTAEGIAGTGIGLYVVKLIVEKHGGSVAVRSIKGVGTTFTVSLPSTMSTSMLARAA